MDSGEETIDNTEVLAQIRRQARKVLLQAAGLAVVITALLVILPET